MYTIADAEIEAVARVIRSRKLFRYMEDSECARFEARYAKYVGVDEFALAASGTNALVAGLVGLEIGPGDEVIIPAHTYMATATAVLAAGAIPVIVDVDDSITLDPAALEASIGPRTRAVIPVHMWGAACDMDAIMDIAERRGLLVLEDCCQGVGGGYKGRKLGSFGHAAAYSFNYYKNITAGEGGGLGTSDPRVAQRARGAIDPCNFFWGGRSETEKPFAGNGARASEVMGAMLNVQLDRLDGFVSAMRAERETLLDETKALGNIGLKPSRMNSPDHDCGAQLMYLMPTKEIAEKFASVFPSVIAGNTGRHTYTEWDQVLAHEGAAHPALNPYNLKENAECRMEYSKTMCARSLDVLGRTVMIAMDPTHTSEEIDAMAHDIRQAARFAFGEITGSEVAPRSQRTIEHGKFGRTE